MARSAAPPPAEYGLDAPAAARPEAPGADEALAEIDALAALLDARYRIPGTRIRFGLDAILGLLPGIGDVATMLPALYLVWRARDLGVPTSLLVRMLGNVGLDTVVGSVPLAGSVFDVFFKANRRNHALIRGHLEDRRRSA